jgi:hypothetical protein
MLKGWGIKGKCTLTKECEDKLYPTSYRKSSSKMNRVEKSPRRNYFEGS